MALQTEIVLAIHCGDTSLERIPPNNTTTNREDYPYLSKNVANMFSPFGETNKA